jgi:hypothetical protein
VLSLVRARSVAPPERPLRSGRLSSREKTRNWTAPLLIPLTSSAPALYDRSEVRSLERTWISCRVAEGRALRRHGNRTGIIYPGRQVPTLSRKRGT